MKIYFLSATNCFEYSNWLNYWLAVSNIFMKTSLDYLNLRYLSYSFRKKQKYISQIICNRIVIAIFCFLVRNWFLRKISVIKAVVSSRFKMKLFRVFEVKTTVFHLQPASTNLEKSCILKQKNCWLWPVVTTLHERMKVISQLQILFES